MKRWRIYSLRMLAILLPMLAVLFVSSQVFKRLGPQTPGDIKYLRTLTPKDTRAIPYATESLQSNNPLVREAAARGLGSIGRSADSATPELLTALGDPSPIVAASAAWALGGIQSDNPAVIVALISKLGDTDGEVRRYAAYALSLYGPQAQQAVPALTLALQDKHMAYMAARALGEIGSASRASIPAMAVLLASSNEGERAEAAMALSQLKPLPRSIENSIELLLQDKSSLVRDIARRAVDHLHSTTQPEPPSTRGRIFEALQRYFF